MANIYLCTSADIYLRYRDVFLFILRECSSPEGFCTVCLGSHLSGGTAIFEHIRTNKDSCGIEYIVRVIILLLSFSLFLTLLLAASPYEGAISH